MSKYSKGLNEFFRSHNMQVKERNLARIDLWVAELTADQQDRLAEKLEEKYEQFRIRAHERGYGIIEEMFPANKDYDWPIARMIADLTDEQAAEEEQQSLLATNISDLGKACARLEQEKNRLWVHGSDEKYSEAEREYAKHQAAFAELVRLAVVNNDPKTLTEAVRYAPKYVARVIGDAMTNYSEGERLVEMLKQQRKGEVMLAIGAWKRDLQTR